MNKLNVLAFSKSIGFEKTIRLFFAAMETKPKTFRNAGLIYAV